MPIPPNSSPPRPDSIRCLPRRWTWIDCRLLESEILATLTGDDAILYLALLCVSDRQGLSWWRDDTLGRRAGLTENAFHSAKQRLIEKALIAWCPFRPGGGHGVYQVLPVAPGGRR